MEKVIVSMTHEIYTFSYHGFAIRHQQHTLLGHQKPLLVNLLLGLLLACSKRLALNGSELAVGQDLLRS